METNLKFEDIPALLQLQQAQLTRIEMMLARPAEPQKPQQFGVAGFHDYLKSLGLEMSPSKQQKMSAKGEIPSHKFNGHLVFIKDEIDEWIQSQTSTNVKANGKSDATLLLAKNANKKLNKGGKSA